MALVKGPVTALVREVAQRAIPRNRAINEPSSPPRLNLLMRTGIRLVVKKVMKRTKAARKRIPLSF